MDLDFIDGFLQNDIFMKLAVRKHFWFYWNACWQCLYTTIT